MKNCNLCTAVQRKAEVLIHILEFAIVNLQETTIYRSKIGGYGYECKEN